MAIYCSVKAIAIPEELLNLEDVYNCHERLYLIVENNVKIKNKAKQKCKEDIYDSNTKEEKNLSETLKILESESQSLVRNLTEELLKLEMTKREQLLLEDSVQQKQEKIASLKIKIEHLSKKKIDLSEEKMRISKVLMKKWTALAILKGFYKKGLNFRIDLCEDNPSILTVSFFRQTESELFQYYVKLKVSQHEDKRNAWHLMEMRPELNNFKSLCKMLKETNDIQGFLGYVYQQFKRTLPSTS